MKRASPSRLFIFAALCVLLAAAFLRLFQLHTLPPGPHYDEAVNLLVTRSIVYGGARPFPILEAYQGREVLYFYFNAPLIVLINDGMFSFHLTNAFANLITVAASMALGRLMFSGRRGMIIGLLMGVSMAIAFPQLWLARQAFRAVTLPLMQSLTLVTLWRGLRGKRRYGWLIAAGVLAGGALYTYNSSRLFPVWLMIGALVLLIADRRAWRTRIPQGIAFFGALTLTALPMAIYAIQRPDIFFNRLAEVTGGETITIAESILLHVQMFFLKGDPYLRYNIPDRPYMTLIEGVLLVIGLAVALWRLIRPGKPLEKAALTLAVLSPLMVIPSVISVGGLPPSHMRSLGMIPLIYVLVGMGFEAISARLKISFRTAVAVLMIGLLVGGVIVGGQYSAWANRADLFYETDADLAAAAAWARETQQPGEILYVAAKDFGHPTFMIAQLPDTRWIGTELLTFPPPGQSALAIFPRSAPPLTPFAGWLDSGRITDGIPIAPDLRPAFDAFRVTAFPADDFDQMQSPPQNAYVMSRGISDEIVSPGQSLDVLMAWEVRAAPPFNDFTPLVQLETLYGVVLSRAEPYFAQTNQWRAGEVFVRHVRLSVPVGTTPGRYPVRIAWVGRAADQYQAYLSADGSMGGIWETIGFIEVGVPPTPITDAPPIAVRADHEVALGVTLLGWDDFSAQRRPGESLPLALYWRAEQTPNLPDFWQIYIGDEVFTGQTFSYAPENWASVGIITQRITLTLPLTVESAVYPLRFEWGENSIDLGTVEIVGSPRVFTAPPFETPLEVQFGDVIALRGYTLEQTAESIRLTLVSEALRAIPDDYTLFVHLVDETGEIVAQVDQQPHENTYPTTLWLAGEYVSDIVMLPVAEFSEIRLGWYLQRTGVRLSLTSAGENSLSSHDFLSIAEVHSQ